MGRIAIYDPGDLDARLRRIAEAENIRKNDKQPSLSGTVLWLVQEWEKANSKKSRNKRQTAR